MLRNNGRHNFRSPYFPQPSLVLDFAGTTTLDPRVTFTRSTTGTYYNSSGVLTTAAINEPRFDFNPTTGESLGLLIEQSSTNLILYSQSYDNAYWTKTASTITIGANIAPDGTQTAQLFAEDTTASSEHRLRTSSITKTSNQVLTNTQYVKPYGRYIILAIESAGNGLYTSFDVVNNLYNDFAASAGWTRGTTSITPLGNGWYRCSISGTSDTSLSVNNRISLSNTYPGLAQQSYTGNGYSGIYIWGAQLEALPFATSYIPTTSAQVTRGSDNASMTGTNLTSVWGSNSGTLYSSAKQYSTSVATYVQVSGSTAYTPAIGVYGSSSNSGVNGAFSISTSAYSANVINKTAFSFSFGNYLLCLNGGSVGTSASTTTLSIPTSLGIGSNGGANYLNGWLQKISLYPQVFTSAQLQALTGS